ncbi:MAG: Fe-S cluster assembly protein SufD [Gammaproteobacteria bacterium]|nr:Fe-S cluster assembly protein SufD [Gammaproteobacteria bacterium]
MSAAIDYLGRRHAELERTEPEWLTATRDKAMQQVLASGLPTTRNEHWKYTNLRTLARRKFEPAAVAVDTDKIPSLVATGQPAASFVNGQLHELSVGDYPATTIAQLLEQQPETLNGRLSALVSYDKHPFAALNTAFFSDGIVIEVPAGAEYTTPLLLEFISAAAEQPALVCPRVLIVLGDNAKLSVIERYAGLPGAQNLTNAVTEVHLGQGAQLSHYRLQELTEADTGMHLLAVHQGGDSMLRTHGVDLGGKLVRNDLHTWLCAPGATAELDGFYLAVASQHVDNHTRVDHSAPHTTSDENYRGVLADKARAVFNGKVYVAKDAQKVDARQSNRNLILSGKAEVDTKPELEIYADDVKCSHGATVGQLDEDAMFYLRSRGIGERTAKALLTFGFIEEILAGFGVAELRQYVETLVTERLPDSERLEVLT